MTLYKLREIITHAKICKVPITYERTGDFDYTVIIRDNRFENWNKALKEIDRISGNN